MGYTFKEDNQYVSQSVKNLRVSLPLMLFKRDPLVTTIISVALYSLIHTSVISPYWGRSDVCTFSGYVPPD